MQPLTTRLAPSPTGALHLGNARTFLINWAIARQRSWRIVLRIEDLDTPRVKPGTIDDTIQTLRTLGIDWDVGPIVQSHDPTPYVAAMESLASRGLVYPSAHSRTEVESAASAPQEGAHEVAFPRSLRPIVSARSFDAPSENWRFVCDADPVLVDDEFAGTHSIDVREAVGDFLVWTRRRTPAYQLAVVVDDARQGVTHIVRGDDLLGSAARQLLVYRALGLSREPSCFHLPLVRGPDGRRLAKRHGDTRLSMYLARGVRPERVIGLVAWWSGVLPSRSELSGAEFRAALDPSRIPRTDITFMQEDDAWLCS